MIGLAIITYNRLNYLKRCIESLEKNKFGGADKVVIIDDCSTDGTVEYLEGTDYTIITKEENVGVAHSKNNALHYLIDIEGCDHVFIMEDDIIMKHPDTCKLYIDYANSKEIHHMNFALHGPLNKGKKFLYNHDISVYPDCVGAFSYYTKECIENVGYFDEHFHNVWEHVEHTWRIAQMGYTTPFWYFADHPLSDKLLEEQPNAIENGVIRPQPNWAYNMKEGKAYFISKHGHWLPARPY